ncbi:ribose-phosphate pyrophosphokinase [Criibacterium bergeronii]|uniref:Ribose-phosphate pyrophosphokinase n=1 Tax=Criibacterium bergeronii TaxID=1871336 RepID=A0A552V920_9FIRM|nr:ribose-phosphate pyrophosphokinase [Criibacterium bergeronii]TRW26967.1 ribose-phosphate pyrophosphokinase [Criibacterium bergeronii]
MNTGGTEMEIFAGNSNIKLATAIADELGLPLGDAEVSKFSDGEIVVNIKETVRGKELFIIQSTSAPTDSNLMELLIMIDACKRASAGRINAVIPYYGYARQDRKAKARDPITAKLVANLITTAGADRVISMDLHASQIQGYFDIPVDHLLGGPILANVFKEKFAGRDDIVIASPDLGSVTRARKFADVLGVGIAIIDKRRPKPNVSEVMNIIGEVKDKTVIIVDDMIDTAGTLVNGANALMNAGANEIYGCCTHAVFSGEAIPRLQNSCMKEIVVLDTIELPKEKQIDKIKTVSVAPVFAKAIRKIYNNESISTIFG